MRSGRAASSKSGRPLRETWAYPFASVLCGVLAFALSGCGADGRVPLFPASGKVVVDGQPAQGVEIRLHPLDKPDDIDALQPFATSEEDGTFQLGTYEKGDGAPAGRYKATLFLPDRPPGPSPPKDLLGGRYGKKESALDVTIIEGPNSLAPFEATKAVGEPSRKRRPAKAAKPDNDAV